MELYERFGWAMFTLSGVCFIAIGIREGDWLTIAGAIVWILGCVAFLLGRGL